MTAGGLLGSPGSSSDPACDSVTFLLERTWDWPSLSEERGGGLPAVHTLFTPAAQASKRHPLGEHLSFSGQRHTSQGSWL